MNNLDYRIIARMPYNPKSQIRDNQINQLLEKVTHRNYAKLPA